jgi:hypothetical protein
MAFVPKEWNGTKRAPTSANFIDCTGCDPGVSASVDEVIFFENGRQMNGRRGLSHVMISFEKDSS